MRTASQWDLTLFGSMVLRRVDAHDAAQVVPLCSQSRQLLAYLALASHGSRHREDLARALWEERGEARAGCLNTALWRLRQTLEGAPFAAGSVLRSHRDGEVGIKPGAPLRIDVDDYRHALLPLLAAPLESLDAAAAERLAAVASRYGGDLLVGVHDDWVLREREKLRQQQLTALRRLVQLCERQGDIAGSIGHALAILELDELREDIHRELMRLYLLAGMRALALRQYERCRAALRRELSIVPMPETQALYQQIAAQAIGRPPVSVAATPTATSSVTATGAVGEDAGQSLRGALSNPPTYPAVVAAATVPPATSGAAVAPVASAVAVVGSPSPRSDGERLSASARLEPLNEARRHLAAADAHLQRALLHRAETLPH